MRGDRRPQPPEKCGGIADRAELDDHARKIVVVVRFVQVVAAWPRGEIVLGRSVQAQRDRGRYGGVMGNHRPDAGRNFRSSSRRDAASRSAATRSALFKITRSAQASWSENTSSSGLSWVKAGSAAR